MDAMKCDGTDSRPDYQMFSIQLVFENPGARTMQDQVFLQQVAAEAGGPFIEVTFEPLGTLRVQLPVESQLSEITMELHQNRNVQALALPESSTTSQE